MATPRPALTLALSRSWTIQPAALSRPSIVLRALSSGVSGMGRFEKHYNLYCRNESRGTLLPIVLCFIGCPIAIHHADINIRFRLTS